MTDLLAKMRQYGREQNIPILRDAEIPLFTSIVRHAQPERVLEIGTAIGYSTLLIAQNMAPGGQITTIELDTARVTAARQFIGQSPYSGQITSLQGDGTALLDTLAGPWDFVFLDGPKGQYLRQLQKIMPKLLPNALIVADNMRYHDMIYWHGFIPHKHRTAITRLHDFLQLIYDTRYFTSVFFENGDGMTVSRWKG